MLRRLAFPSCGRILLSLAFLLLALSFLLAGLGRADDAPGNRATLKGIPGVRVVVAPTNLDAERDRLRSGDIETDVERQLQDAGIPVTRSAPDVLYIDVDARKTGGSPRYACTTRVELLQLVNLERDPQITVFASTWGLVRVEEVSAYDLPRVRVTVRELVDRFITAYREQNPKR